MSVASQAKLKFEREHSLDNCIVFPEEELISDTLIQQMVCKAIVDIWQIPLRKSDVLWKHNDFENTNTNGKGMLRLFWPISRSVKRDKKHSDEYVAT